jgi:hypothetical protein
MAMAISEMAISRRNAQFWGLLIQRAGRMGKRADRESAGGQERAGELEKTGRGLLGDEVPRSLDELDPKLGGGSWSEKTLQGTVSAHQQQRRHG